MASSSGKTANRDNPSQQAPGDGAAGSATEATARLLEVMAELRGEAGCPWDKSQTHRTLIPYLIEEAYELIDAIERDDDAHLCEELGDVLLQVVFHARIAEERSAFGFADVAGGLAAKLEDRHPHVFRSLEVDSPEAVSQAWHQDKMRSRDSALDGVPKAQPALQWAHQIGQRAARSGFEWGAKGQIFDKAAEELAEFKQELSGTAVPANREAAEMEFGDLLFSLVQLARWEGIDPEAALRRATRKFMGRFQWMEQALRARGLQADQQNPGQWWALWEEAKAGTE